MLYNETGMAEEEKEKKSVTLSDDFQAELEKKKHSTNWLGVLGIFAVSVVGLAVLAVGSYQIFFKPEEVEKNTGAKIESKPIEPEKKPGDETKPESVTQPTTNDKTQGASQEYIIVEGDNLGSIAVKFDTTVEKLKTANNIQDETTLQIGQKIIIVK